MYRARRQACGGAGARRLTTPAANGHASDPAWSPDGRQFAFAGLAARGRRRVYLGEPDGARPAFVRTVGPDAVGPAGAAPDFEVFVTGVADGRTAANLTNDRATGTSPSWSPEP